MQGTRGSCEQGMSADMGTSAKCLVSKVRARYRHDDNSSGYRHDCACMLVNSCDAGTTIFPAHDEHRYLGIDFPCKQSIHAGNNGYIFSIWLHQVG